MDTSFIIGIISGILLLFSFLLSLFKYKRLPDVAMTSVAVAIVCSYFELNISSFYSDVFNGKGVVESYRKNLIDSSDHSPATEILFWLFTSSIIMCFISLCYYAFTDNSKKPLVSNNEKIEKIKS
jgi:hypothetical protein